MFDQRNHYCVSHPEPELDTFASAAVFGYTRRHLSMIYSVFALHLAGPLAPYATTGTVCQHLPHYELQPSMSLHHLAHCLLSCSVRRSILATCNCATISLALIRFVHFVGGWVRGVIC